MAVSDAGQHAWPGLDFFADRLGGGGHEMDEVFDDLRINTWNQVEVFAPVVAAAWHSKGEAQRMEFGMVAVR